MPDIRDIFNALGTIDRLQQHADQVRADQEAVRNSDNIASFAGNQLRFFKDAAIGGALGLPLEAMQTSGDALAGLLAIPAVYAEAATGNNPLDKARSQALIDGGLGNLVAHPGRTIDALRTSDNDITSYLAGILAMGSDPTNVLLSPVAGFANAEKAASAAARASAGTRAFGDVTHNADDVAKMLATSGPDASLFDKLDSFDQLLMQSEARNNPDLTHIEELAQRLSDAKDNTAGARFALDESKDYYSEARGAVSAELKRMRQLGLLEPKQRALRDGGLVVDAPENADIIARNAARINAKKDEVLARFPGGPVRGQTYHEYLREPRQALYAALNEEQQIAQLYAEAKAAVKPIKYNLEGVPLGADKNMPRIGHINARINAALNENPIPRASADELLGIPDAEQAVGSLPIQTPDARLQEFANLVDDVANAKPLIGPEDAGTYGSRLRELLAFAFKEGLKEQRAAMAREGVRVNFGQLASIWKGVATQTLRNIFMDEAYSRIIAGNAGIRQEAITRSEKLIVKRLKAAGVDSGNPNPMLLMGDLSDVMQLTGSMHHLDEAASKTFMGKLGANYFELETDNIRQLSAMQQLVGTALVGAANPIRASLSPLMLPLGYLAPMRQRAFHIINNVTHMASRSEAFAQGYYPYLENSAKSLLDAASAEGKDVGKLVGRGFGDKIREGAFSVTEVRTILGQRYADEWARMLGNAEEAGFKRATEVFGNFANRSALERTVDKFFPFMSWSWRAYPRVARMVLEHPAVGAAVMQLYQADAEQAKQQGRPGYQYGTLSINNDTPFVGALLNIFSPEQEAELRFNPISFINPVNNEAVAAVSGGDVGGNDTLYEKASNAAGILGASPNPLIEAMAYIHGDTYQGPGAMSRYANIDQAVDNVPGLPDVQIPSLLHGSLRKAREVVAKEKDTYDPVKAKAYELVYERTGYPVSDYRNRRVAAAIDDGSSPYLALAEVQLDLGGAARSLFNAGSPVSLQLTSETKKNERQAKLGMPHTYEEIQLWKELLPSYASQLEYENAMYLRGNPDAAVQKRPQVSERDKVLLAGERRRALLAAAAGIGAP